uniref:Structural maintenance of chromosomes protein 6 n=1 Tax=Amphiprion ocellaris TaxID=80972 RepID=A0AAQ5XFB7_AMPOC
MLQMTQTIRDRLPAASLLQSVFHPPNKSTFLSLLLSSSLIFAFCLCLQGDIGLIESISLKNFMCHRSLGPFRFGPNVNFIVGNNGSGKSAILTALIVGLGGKATMTNRGVSLKDFVKTSETAADITVKLRNRGPDAYKKDVYGDYISIEHRIWTDGSRTCKLKNKSGHLVSSKKEELTGILDHFNIQLDNPVSILSQEMSKQFLHSKSESDKYKFFMKATLLEQMRADYVYIKHTKTVTRQQVERQEECLKDLKQEFLQKKERYEKCSSFSELKAVLENLKKAMAWCLVRAIGTINALKKDPQNPLKYNNFFIFHLLLFYKVSIRQAEKKLQFIKSRSDSLRDEQKSLSEDSRKLKEQVKIVSKAHKEQEVQRNNLEEQKQHRKRQKTLCDLKEKLVELQNKCSQLNQEISNKHQALFKGREERDKLRLEERNVQASVESKLKRKNQLHASRSNKLKRFGDHVPELMALIAEAHTKGRFRKKPIGPIGACIHLNDPTLAVAVECCLRSFMKAFCCDNYKDEAVLQEIMSRFYSKGNRPQIIVSPFSDKLYNIDGRKAYHPEYPSVPDVITATSPVIVNCLVDMRGIESILIIKEKDKARRVMQQGRPPKNCREAFTAEGDQVYPNRYYTSDFSMAKYLGGDLETEIRYILSAIAEEVAQENQEKMEAEKRTVQEAKMELDKHRKQAEDADSQYSSLRDRIDQLSEEMEPLKVQGYKYPERQQVTSSTKSIDTEITRLKRKIKVYESSHGEHEQYAEALALYREKANQVRDLRRFIDRLDNIMSDRQNRYKVMRRSLSVRCKLYFSNFLIKMNYCGSMIFDHNNETLAISVCVEEDGVSDVRTLSGGERSFSTICFMLSLWEITESPFRCLDEFDVYMDMHNRSICLNLLLELSERQHLRQFIFITPLTTSHMPKSSLIKVHQLQDPERERSQNTR